MRGRRLASNAWLIDRAPAVPMELAGCPPLKRTQRWLIIVVQEQGMPHPILELYDTGQEQKAFAELATTFGPGIEAIVRRRVFQYPQWSDLRQEWKGLAHDALLHIHDSLADEPPLPKEEKPVEAKVAQAAQPSSRPAAAPQGRSTSPDSSKPGSTTPGGTEAGSDGSSRKRRKDRRDRREKRAAVGDLGVYVRTATVYFLFDVIRRRKRCPVIPLPPGPPDEPMEHMLDRLDTRNGLIVPESGVVAALANEQLMRDYEDCTQRFKERVRKTLWMWIEGERQKDIQAALSYPTTNSVTQACRRSLLRVLECLQGKGWFTELKPQEESRHVSDDAL